MNGDTVNGKIQQGKIVEERLKAGKTPQDIVTELYIVCLSRKPTKKEMASLTAILSAEKNDQQVLNDIFWALCNSREFIFIH